MENVNMYEKSQQFRKEKQLERIFERLDKIEDIK